MIEFKTQEFDTARELLDALCLMNREWWTYAPASDKADQSWVRSWFFRGQSNVEWSLRPAAWRRNSKEISYTALVMQDRMANSGVAIHIQQALSEKWERLNKSRDDTSKEWEHTNHVIWYAFAEYVLVKEFVELADSLGHHMPEMADITRDSEYFIDRYIGKMYGAGNQHVWTHPCVALAQHHQIPTRLLDWTRQPFVAAYFAAESVAEDPPENQKIAVYAIHDVILQHHIKKVSVPSSDNQYLRVQEGIFTYDDFGDKLYIDTGEYPTLEESVKLLPPLNPIVHPQIFVLPATQARELLRLLWIQRFSQAHLMPTLDNVANAVKMKLRLIEKQREANSHEAESRRKDRL